jgi:outer membrane protein
MTIAKTLWAGRGRRTGLAARGERRAAFGRRCIPPGCVAPRSNSPGILVRRALPAGRIAGLGATPAFHHGLLAVLIAAASVLAATAAQAQHPATPAGSLDDLVRQAAERFARTQGSGPTRTAVDQPPSASPARSLTIDDAVKMALDKNLDIAVQRLNPQMYDFSLASIKAVYLPTFTSLIGDQHQTAVPISLLTGGQQVTTSTGTVNGQLTQNLPRGGGNLNATWNNNRVFSNSFFYNYNPAFNTNLSAQYTQPLLRGLHADAARQQLAVTKVNRAVSDLQLKSTITNTVTSVRDAYWDLVLAVESIEVAKASVDLARQLVDENQKRVQAGAMTRLDLLTATSQEATGRHALVLAEGTRRTAELALKRLLVAGPDDELWRAVIEPADRPEDTAQAIDLEAAIKRALVERTDLAQAKQQVAANDATILFLHDQTRPQADLVASYGLAGLGGTQLIRDTQGPSPFTAPVVATIPGAYGNALNSLFGHNYPTWGIALNVTYPLGYSAARAAAARAEIQARQVVAETHQLEVQVVTEVTDAAIAARNAFDEIETARQAQDLAAQKLDAEQKKFGVGLSTNYLVVQGQKDLADARNAVLRAEIMYQKALVDFERAQQTTLQSAGVTVISPAAPVPTTGSGRPASTAPSGSFIP